MEQLELFKSKKPQSKDHVKEWKFVSVRECPTPEDLRYCDTPQKAADYWRLHVEGHPFFEPERECFVVIVLNTNLRAGGQREVRTAPSQCWGAAEPCAASRRVCGVVQEFCRRHEYCGLSRAMKAITRRECFVSRHIPFAVNTGVIRENWMTL